jgi:hypothetical protein
LFIIIPEDEQTELDARELLETYPNTIVREDVRKRETHIFVYPDKSTEYTDTIHSCACSDYTLAEMCFMFNFHQEWDVHGNPIFRKLVERRGNTIVKTKEEFFA